MGKKSVAQDNWEDFSFQKEDRWSKKRKYLHEYDDTDDFEKKRIKHQKHSKFKFEDDE